MANVLRLADSGHAIEQLLAEEGGMGRAFTAAISRFCSIAGIDGEIADTKRGEVLEEVSALRGVDAIVGECHLGDDACTGDVRPLHRNAKPRIAGAPTAGSNEGIAATRCQELLVEPFYLHCYLRIVGCIVVLVGLHIDYIAYIIDDAVTEGVVGAQQALAVVDGPQVFVDGLHGVDDGAYLQEVELCLLSSEVAGKLYLHRSFHSVGTTMHGFLQDFGQRHDILLQHTTECDDLASSVVDAVADDLVVGVVGRGDAVERAVGVGLFYLQVENIKTIVDLKLLADIGTVEGIEARLRLA